MSNAFETYAEAAQPKRPQVTRPVRQKAATDAALEERDELLRGFKAKRRAEVEALLAGPHGRELRGLQSFMRTMTASSAPALVTFIERAAWVRTADDDTRHIVLGMVSHGIARVRQKEGLPPFDDAILDEPPAAFEQIRDALRRPA